MAKHLSWIYYRERATEFAASWAGGSNEKSEAQDFWRDFFEIFDIKHRSVNAYFEYASSRGHNPGGFIDLFWPGKLIVEHKSLGKDLTKAKAQAFEYFENLPEHDRPQVVVACDFQNFVYIDLDTNIKKEFSLVDLPKNIELFKFILGESNRATEEQHPVNRKAAEIMAQLHNDLAADNYIGHNLEILLVRLVFVMFADDSGIFDEQLLYEYLQNRTSEDGSDLGARLTQIFQLLNTPAEQRQTNLDEELASLPYVDSGLFSEILPIPNFTTNMREQLLEAMKLDWSKASPAIFGSMFQGVMDEEQRHNLGAHYTSEANILKVIKPLFLDDLYRQYDQTLKSGPKKKYDELRKLHAHIAGLKFLDPACGCGNFLVITYRELRRLEHKILSQLSIRTVGGVKYHQSIDMFASAGHAGVLKCNVDQMYGIEIEEFPSLVAQTAMWLTDHQMNMEYSAASGTTFKRIPITASATIANVNALTTDWSEVIDADDLNYILGNPPFNGSRTMDRDQKADLLSVAKGLKEAGLLDFVAGWYLKATEMMKLNPRIRTALVSTNSITQGEQVSILWKPLLKDGVNIDFAHQTFKWSNEAKGNAAVYCVIVGFSMLSGLHKRLFEYASIKADPIETIASNINPYLADASNVLVGTQQHALSNVPEMNFGNMPADGGNLILSALDRTAIINESAQAQKYIYELIGAKELIQGGTRYCLWLTQMSPSELRSMPKILERVNATRAIRASSSRPQLAERPMLFAQITADPNQYEHAIAIPRVSSESRRYIPMGFFNSTQVIGDTCMVLPGASLYHFGILNSQMHMAWMRTVAGRLKSDYRYSKDIVYNNFVWPVVTADQKNAVEKLSQAILDARAEFAGETLADLYDQSAMPASLRFAHAALDRYVDSVYGLVGMPNDSARVEKLFGLYQKAVSK